MNELKPHSLMGTLGMDEPPLQAATFNHAFPDVYLWRESGLGGSTFFIQILIFAILVFNALDAALTCISLAPGTISCKVS